MVSTCKDGRVGWWLSIVLSSVLILISWCAMDYVYVVHPAWNRAHPSSEPIGFVALLAAVCAVCLSRHRRDLRVAASTLLASILLGVVLVVFVGMRFHFSIGGQL